MVVLPAAAAGVLEAEGIRVVAESWNDIQLQDAGGVELLSLTGIQLKGLSGVKVESGSVGIIDAGGGRGFEVSYSLGDAAGTSGVKVTGRFVPSGHRLDVEFTAEGLPEGVKVDGSMFGRRFPSGGTALDPVKPALWTRHRNGGVPYEVPEGLLIPYDAKPGKIWFAFPMEHKVNPAWRDASSQHLAMTRNGPDSAIARFSIIVPPADWSAAAIASRWRDRPVGLEIATDRVYNLWTDAAEPLALHATLANVTDAERGILLKHLVRDYSGNLVAEGERALSIKPSSSVKETLSIKAPSSREILFAEVSAIDRKTGVEVFSRTNLAILPPHEFKAASADSLFGIAAYWPIPTEEDAQNLMERMGVRWLRHGTAKYRNITAIHHSNPKWTDAQMLTGEARHAWIRKELQQCLDHGNPWWEFGNELNMSTAGIAMEGVGIGKALLAEKYVDWLKDVHRIRREMGAEEKVKILSFGIAGLDLKFVDRFRELGGWDLIDGFALHPGRGNVAPDYPVTDPFAETKIEPKGGYWNYYGSVRTAALMLRTYPGNKPLWLTEIYAPTFPNSFWEDSMRHGTENLVLTYALARAEGVKSAMWYQLFDSVWHDRLGADDKDREYHFGLLNRDLSLKPLVLAYATIAEALDGAVFKGWIRFDEPSARGLSFDTPRGPMAVLWSRADGYTLSRKVPDFPSPEAWVDTWKTKTPLEIAAEGAAVTVLNPIGQPAVLPAEGGKARLELTGTPAIVYGIRR